MPPRATLPLAAAATFLAGFGVAELTGVRALGGVVLLAGGVWCARLAYRLAGAGPTSALLVIALGLFVASHPLGHLIGAWPAVVVSAGLAAVACVAVVRSWRKTDARPADTPIAGGAGLTDDPLHGGLGPDRR
jgi:hypothetical protein